MSSRATDKRGMGLIDALFGIAMMSLVFWALFGVFRLSIEMVISSKAKIGALALANEQIEFIRSLSYSDVGTVGGIPSGVVPQSEILQLNQSTYTRRTFIQYTDAPQDGTGVNDENGITADYKTVKVELTWDVRNVERTYALVTTIVPRGMESLVGGGTISVTVLDSYGLPLQGADVHIVNATTDPAIDVATFSNADGMVFLPGAPAASDYQVVVTKEDYSTAQTYGSTADNPNPNPSHLSVVEAQTTSATFAIDRVASLTVYTYEPIQEEFFSDKFVDTSLLSSLASTTAAGSLQLQNSGGLFESEGSATSLTIAPEYLYRWGVFSWENTVPLNTSVRYEVLYESSPGVFDPLPDAVLPGNAAGFSTSPVDLTAVPVVTYPSLRLRALLSTGDGLVTPAIEAWDFSYEVGPIPIPNVAFVMQGAKTIGTDAGAAPIYKYESTDATDASGSIMLPALEWDTYTLTVGDPLIGPSPWDVAESCPFQPMAIGPGSVVTDTLYLVPDMAHSLLVSVVDEAGDPTPDASVRVYRASYDETELTSSCGQIFFGGLIEANNYTVEVTKSGYQMATVSNLSVEDASQIVVVLQSN